MHIRYVRRWDYTLSIVQDLCCAHTYCVSCMSMCEWHGLLQAHSKASDPKSCKQFVFGAPRTPKPVMAVYLCAKYLEWHTAVLLVPNSSLISHCFSVILVCLLCTVPDVTSSLVPSMTSVAQPAPRNSVSVTLTEPTSDSASNVAPSHFPAPSDQLFAVGDSSADSNSMNPAQFPSVIVRGGPSTQVSGATIGAVVVAAVVVLVVVSVIVAASLIAWRVRSGAKAYTGVHFTFFYSMSVLLGSAVGECMLHLHGFHLFYINVLYPSWCCVHCVGDKS